jgi:hypothetical protein
MAHQEFRSMVNPLPPSFSVVWLGRLAQEADRELNFLTVGADGGRVNSVGGIQAYVTTMAFGHVVISDRNRQGLPASTARYRHPSKEPELGQRPCPRLAR